ncbi:LysM peptidoglycan-binding domain-containing protein [Candidatus Kaiserbacteria bacterium]|nr:LysM peptidoglycan-binding domain-containing protein [Candidatus Kaiserbacteria bacterium]
MRGAAGAVAALVSILVVAGSFTPSVARAGILADIIGAIAGSTVSADSSAAPVESLQTLELARPATNIDPTVARGGGDIIIVDDTALLPDEGPSGTIADIEKPKNATISVYTVRAGDTIASIAKLHDVSPDTIRWANDIPAGGGVRVGQTLTILPVTGIRHTVRKGDTIASIAKRAGADATDIATFNGLDVAASLEVGTTIIVPDGEAAPAPAPASAKKSVPKKVSTVLARAGAAISGYIAPLSRYVATQGIHGYNAVDMAAPVGTPIMASAAGKVIVAKSGGWNGGYGSYVVVQHANGSQTLYAHMSRVNASSGDQVSQGEVIGYVGNTGKSTGAHLHFEIRNGIRNPF